MGISHSTLYREIKRGTAEQLDTNLRKYKRYFYDVGQRVYEENKANSRNAFKFVKAYEFIKYDEKEILKNKLSLSAARKNSLIISSVPFAPKHFTITLTKDCLKLKILIYCSVS